MSVATHSTVYFIHPQIHNRKKKSDVSNEGSVHRESFISSNAPGQNTIKQYQCEALRRRLLDRKRRFNVDELKLPTVID